MAASVREVAPRGARRRRPHRHRGGRPDRRRRAPRRRATRGRRVAADRRVRPRPKRPGDPVYSGSYPTLGRGRYVAETVGEASLAGRITAGARTFRRTLTPLQREIQAVIRVTLLIVLYLQLLLIVKNVLLDVPLDEAVIEATVLVGLIPNGLFVSIAIAYALAAVRMSAPRRPRPAGQRRRVAQPRRPALRGQDGHADGQPARARADRAARGRRGRGRERASGSWSPAAPPSTRRARPSPWPLSAARREAHRRGAVLVSPQVERREPAGRRVRRSAGGRRPTRWERRPSCGASWRSDDHEWEGIEAQRGRARQPGPPRPPVLPGARRRRSRRG